MGGAIGFLIPFVFVIIWSAIVIGTIIHAMKNKDGHNDKQNYNNIQIIRDIKKYHSDKKKEINRDIKDNRDDWLSQQLREEKQSKILMYEMFNLADEHHENCDVEKLKQEHLKQHGKY